MDIFDSIKTQISKKAVESLLIYCRGKGFDHLTLVADQNEYRVLGERVENALKSDGFKARRILLEGDPVIPDDSSLVSILAQVDDCQTTFVSVGSGTITDLTRFVAFRTKSDFISLPTAPSMDGYASSGSSLILSGMKQTIISKPPIAIFADLDVLCEAPRPMISSGFGDVIGKFTALADWDLSRLLWNDRYLKDIAQRTQNSLLRCVGMLEDLESNWTEAIHALTESLIDVGICMMITGNSRPASGAEHSTAHFWEMKLLREGRPIGFHGTKVGFATSLIARLYERLREMDLEEAEKRLSVSCLPEAESEIQTIKRVFGPAAAQAIAFQKPFLEMSPEKYRQLKEHILDNWEQIQVIAAAVPSEEQIRHYLLLAGLPLEPAAIHLKMDDVHQALAYAHYLRNHFTVVKLLRVLGVKAEELW